MRKILASVAVTMLLGCQPSATPTPASTASGAPPSKAASPAALATLLPSPSTAPASPRTSGFADLDGLDVGPELAHRLPLAISIDDNIVSRPQSGFNASAVVWHAPADGYETRYLLLIQEADARNIGPVRSSRIYQAHWAAEVVGALAHYGGDRRTRRWMIDNRGTLFTDVDGLGAGNDAYHRISSREAPHNAYTSSDDLWRVAAELGGAATLDPRVHVRTFREDAPVAERGTSQQIAIPYSTVRVGYTYDPASNAYLRTLNGRPHIDPLDGEQVAARTVIVAWMPFRTDPTIEPGHNRPVLGYIGSGPAQVFSDGKVIEGTWSKASPTAPTLFLGPKGKELWLVRGRIFIQVVPTSTDIDVEG